jgi:hypothetical protein
MMDDGKAVIYAKAKGKVVENARLARILWRKPPSKETLKELEAL